MPEKLAAVEHIKEVRKRAESAQPKLELAAEHAKGLIGSAIDGM
jgi:hypothetical protein